MKQNIVTRDRILILISGFFYFASPMLVTPLITGFSENLGASAALMGVIGGLMNICSLFCRPFVGNLTDKISKYKLSFIGAVLMAAASVGYAAAQSPLFIVAARIVNGIGFSLCSVCISTWMSTLLPKEKIGSGMGIYGAMNALAMAAAFMAGGYGMMCSACQSKAILLAGEGKRGLANSTYYIGLDLGMSLGPMLGGVLYGNVSIQMFYPVLALTVPLGLIIYRINRRSLSP